MGRTGRGWSRNWRFVGMMIALMALAAACGGAEDAATGFPPYPGAERLGRAVPPQEQLDALAVKLSDAGASLYRSGDELDAITTFYSEDVKADGWTVPITTPISDAATISVMHKDMQIAAVMVMTGSMAKLFETAITSQGLQFEPDKIQPGDVIILESHFTCGEPEVQACLDALTRAAGQ